MKRPVLVDDSCSWGTSGLPEYGVFRRRMLLASAGLAVPPFLSGCGGSGSDVGTAVPASAAPDAATIKPLQPAPVVGLPPAQPQPPTPLPSVWPAWRQALRSAEWAEIPTARLAAVGPSNRPGATVGGAPFPDARIDAWNGIAVVGTRVVMAGTGGHGDWAGNEAYSCDLSVAQPVWKMLREPTPDVDISIDVAYYRDGRPTSSHTYYALHGDTTRNRVFRVGIGAGFGTGNFNRAIVDAFDFAANDWDAAGRWPTAPEALSIGQAQTFDETSGDVYAAGQRSLLRLRGDTRTWETLAAFPNNGTSSYYRASVFDAKRRRVVILGDRYRSPRGVLALNLSNLQWVPGLAVVDALGESVVAEAGLMAHHHLATDTYLVKTSSAGEVVRLNPDNLTASQLPVINGASVPSPRNGVFGKFARVAALGGYAYQPRGASSLWFLAEPT